MNSDLAALKRSFDKSRLLELARAEGLTVTPDKRMVG